jgi:cysteine desulfurase/selenocysteine lyase
MNEKYKQLRKDFPILSQQVEGYPFIYVDNAATTHKPQSVIDAVVGFYTTSNASVYRGIHTFAEKTTQLYEDARGKVARFIGALPEEIIFTSGATEGINCVVDTWGQQCISAGDEIVLTELEHHANLLPWQRLAQKKGAVLKFIPVTADGTLDFSFLDTIITHKTKMVAFVHVSNTVGTHNDSATIIAAAKKVGARVLIDAAQSVGHQKIDVAALGCDFLVFSGHKMLAPTGVGVLFMKKELHNAIEPHRVGGGMVENVTLQAATWAAAPHKFEAGTPPIAQVIGLGVAVDYLKAHIDFDELRIHEARLCARLIEGLSGMSSVRILGPIEELKKNGHLVGFLVDGLHSHDVAAFLSSRGIAVRAGHHCAQPFARALGYDASVRVSFYFYNTAEEVDCIIEALRELLQ